jgi:hypothetical protein
VNDLWVSNFDQFFVGLPITLQLQPTSKTVDQLRPEGRLPTRQRFKNGPL